MKRFLLVYGSQTGQSQVISEQIAEKATSKGFKVDLSCLDQSGVKFRLEEEPVIVIVCSSTGDGDPPDNAAKFWRKLRKRSLPEDHLAKCHYTVLGLGDSNYSNFCNMGKLLDERMSSLGGTRFYDVGFADDAVGLEAVVEPWIEGLWDALSSLFDQETNEEHSTKTNIRIFPDVVVGKQMRSHASKDSILSTPDELRMKGISSPVPNKQLDYGPGPDSLLVPNLLGHDRKRTGSLPISIDVRPSSELVRSSTVGARQGEEAKKSTKDVDSLPPISSKLSLTASPKFGKSSRSPSTSPNPDRSPNQDKKKFTFGENGSTNSLKSSPSHQVFSPPLSNSPQPSPPISPRPLRSVRCSSPVLPSQKLRSLPKNVSSDSFKTGDKPMFYSPQLPRSKKPDSSPHRRSTLKSVYSSANNQESPTKSAMLWTGYSQGSLKPLEGRELSNDSLDSQEHRKKILASAADIVNGLVIQRHQQLPKIRASSLSSPSLNRPLQQHNRALPSTEEEAEESSVDTLSLQLSNSGLEQKELNLPSFQPPFLKVDVKKPIQDGTPYPAASVTYTTASQLYSAHLVSAKKITADDAAKCTLQMSFRVEPGLEGKEFSYEPGDALGFVCPNDSKEVDFLLERLGLMSIADYEINLQILSETRKKNPVIPKHIPATCSVRHFFTYCAAIRSIPKKAFLFMLSQYTDNEKEKRRLEELCSKQGASEFTHLFIEYHLDLLDVLDAFPSCTPPLPRLIEFLPKLQPRYYSVACSPTVSPNHFDIVFNVERIPNREWMKQSRYGVCSGWLSRLAQQIMSTTGESSVDPPKHQEQVTIFTRLLNPFHLPADPSTPIIMVGPGTGVAPFIGFLQHRRSLSVKKELLGSSWLFYGCRHPLKDYLFKKELAAYVADGTLTHLLVSFSRYEEAQGHRHYVQDNIRAKGKLLSEAIMECNAVVYVCGDAHNMSKDVKEAFIDVLSEYFQDKASPVASAEEMLASMQEDRRYILDIWT